MIGRRVSSSAPVGGLLALVALLVGRAVLQRRRTHALERPVTGARAQSLRPPRAGNSAESVETRHHFTHESTSQTSGPTNILAADLARPGRRATETLTAHGTLSINLLTPALASAAFCLWALSLRTVDVRQITDLGLVSVLPPIYFAAIGLLLVSFALAVHARRLSTPVLLFHVVLLIGMLFGTTEMVELVPRFGVSWRHAGFAEFIMRTETVAPSVDAYFNWPMFFVITAFASTIAGFANPIDLTTWAPVFFNVLYLPPLLVLLGSFTRSRRTVWVGVWLFYLANWTGQDYFAPQALNMFLYLALLAILLHWFKNPEKGPTARFLEHAPGLLRLPAGYLAGWLEARTRPGAPSSRAQRGALASIWIGIFALSVSSHQLTPFFALAAVSLLVLADRITPRTLPVLMAVMLSSWISFMTVAFLTGHTNMVAGDIGNVSANVSANVINRLVRGSPDHQLVVVVRLVMTVAIGILAVCGLWYRLRHGHRELAPVLLILAPVPFLALQSYGGELLLRVYLFALAPMTYFAARLLTARWVSGWRSMTMLAVASIVLFAGFSIARFGNERMDYFTPNELQAVQHLYQIAEPGSYIVAGADDLPWKFENYEQYHYSELDPIAAQNLDLSVIYEGLTPDAGPAYLILTRSTGAYLELFDGLPQGSQARLEDALKSSNQFRVLYSNPDAVIFGLDAPPPSS